MSSEDHYYHIPVQIMTSTDTTGRITPIRFRFRDTDSQVITVNVNDVVSYDEKAIYTIIRVYASMTEDRRQLIDLTYHRSNQTWFIDWVRD